MAVWYALADLFLSRLDAETAHGLALKALKSGLTPGDRRSDPAALGVKVWGRQLPNPIGLAAGFDKNAEAPDALLGLGFGFVEIGSVTPRPQPGNPRPRLFRVPEAGLILNRMGFNSEGAEVVAARLDHRPKGLVVGGNLGKNKETPGERALDDYAAAYRLIAPR